MALALGSRAVGTCNPASLVSSVRSSRRTAGGSEKPARLWFKRRPKAFTITTPNTAIASTPATRATALLIPEAVPTRSSFTEFMTEVVRGATVTAIPNPRTTIAGKKAFQ